MREGGLFQSFVCILTVFALLLSTVAFIRSEVYAKEVFFIRGRIQELEVQLANIPTFPDNLLKYGKWFK